MIKNPANNTQRYYLIDSIRGFAIINMVMFHLVYDLFEIFNLNSGWYFQPLTSVWEHFICVTFILISGISFNFSTHAYKRGIILNIFGFVITAVTVLFIPEQVIWFGILNFLGCAMLILQTLRKFAEKIPPFLGAVFSLILFSLFYGISKGYIGFFKYPLIELPRWFYSCKYLAFLGLPSSDFISTDYFPIVPWIFLFGTGFFVWRVIKNHNADRFFKFRIPILDSIGRYSLWIYLAHQPIIFGVLTLLNSIGLLG